MMATAENELVAQVHEASAQTLQEALDQTHAHCAVYYFYLAGWT